MPGVLPSEGSGPARGSPSKKNRLSLKLFQKKEAKRALDFTESQENEQKSSEFRGSEVYVRVSLFVGGGGEHAPSPHGAIPQCTCTLARNYPLRPLFNQPLSHVNQTELTIDRN